MNLKITSAGKTDIGLVRTTNEDSIWIDDELNLFLVCDGMGGHLAGEVASKEACDIIQYCFGNLGEEISRDSVLKIPASFPVRGDLLVKSIRIANRSIYIKSRSRSDYSGMGTTIVSAVLQDDLINIAHVGDSRAYLFADDRLVPLTTDHSWVAELEQSGQYSPEEVATMANKNVITRALGIHETVEIDFRVRRVKPGDVYILCSDGLCGYASDDEIYTTVRQCGGDVGLIADRLVQMANERGGVDNVSIVTLRIDHAEGATDTPEVNPVTISHEGDEAILRENQLVESVIRLRREAETIVQKPEKKSSKGFGIFVFLVVLVAAYIIYRLLF